MRVGSRREKTRRDMITWSGFSETVEYPGTTRMDPHRGTGHIDRGTIMSGKGLYDPSSLTLLREKLGWATSRSRGKATWRAAVRAVSPSEKTLGNDVEALLVRLDTVEVPNARTN